jgi:hypothetical protein
MVHALDQMWPEDRAQPAQLTPTATRAEPLYDKIQVLVPQNDSQRSIQAEALSLATDIAQTRWLMFEQWAVRFPALPGDVGFLAHHSLRELRPRCAP